MRLQRWWLFAGMLVVLSGCGTQPVIPEAPANNPRLAQVHTRPNDYRGLAVRWGGTLVEVENRAQETVLLIMGQPLDDDGRPRPDGASQGRFMAKINGFLDPVIYSAGRSVTVVGMLVGAEPRKIGGYTYHYPVVAVEAYHLWPQSRQMARYSPCFNRFWYGSPFYYPWYRFGYLGPAGYCW
ncbi:MAG: Slp family lipoprotein [Nitrococcus mobilis]|nr:Slp family lipoprotein [Nitrococcus mobilis]